MSLPFLVKCKPARVTLVSGLCKLSLRAQLAGILTGVIGRVALLLSSVTWFVYALITHVSITLYRQESLFFELVPITCRISVHLPY